MVEFVKDLFKSNSGVSSKRLISFIALAVLVVYVFTCLNPNEHVIYTLAGLVVSSQSLTVLTAKKTRE